MDANQQQALLAIARQAIEARLSGVSTSLPSRLTGLVETFGGVFVSLHNGRRLRGCVGRLECEGHPLEDFVRCMALAVLDDPRFATHPVTLAEMANIDIEISLLSPMTRTSDPLTLEAGVHGVYVRRGMSTGCFLPQVAMHMGWNSEQMLSHCCCDKAGLPADAWRDPETEVYLFTAQIIAESPR